MPRQKKKSRTKNSIRIQDKKKRNKPGKQGNDPAFRFSVEDIASMHDIHRRKSGTEKIITGGIVITIVSIVLSLFAYISPSSARAFVSAAGRAYGYAVSCKAKLRVSIFGSMTEDFLAVEKDILAKLDQLAEPGEETEVISSINHTSELGDIARFNMEPSFSRQEDAVYTCMLDTAMGPLLYYNQGDVRWKDYLYGGSDPISRYGCGPVCAAMVINSFSSTSVSPVEIADWSLANGCYAPQSGSYHSLIPNSISAYGLQVDSVTDRSAENAAELLRTGHILVALMGKGSLTQNGHFIIIAQLRGNGNVYIADPASYENCTKEWDLQQLMNELKRSYDSGGPLWAVSYPENSEP